MTVVKVNHVGISREEVDRTLDRLILELEDRMPPEQVEQARPHLKTQAVENLVNQSLLVQEADRSGVQSDEAEVEKRFSEIAGRFPAVESFRTVLGSMGMSEDAFRTELGQHLKIELLLASEVGSQEKVTQEEVEDFYRDNPENFALQEKVRARHILISTEPDDSEPLRAQKREEISRLRVEIEDGGDFAGLAGRHSGCPTRSEGGDLGFFERGRMARPFEEAAFNLRPGELSGVVETEFGYHLIQVTERQEAGVVPLERAREKIAEYLSARKNEKRIGAYLQGLRRTAVVEYADGALD